MIIGISGYIGSGKDTVGKMIQETDWYAARDDMGAGKKIYAREGAKFWEIKKFAGKLKQVASILTGIPVENFEDQEFKKTEMGAMWGMSVREFLQKLGTEGLRNGLHENVWVNALMVDYKMRKEGYPNWIITDTRFPNEAQAIKDVGGIIIRVKRPDKIDDTSVWGNRIRRHESETSLDDWDFDEVIENDGSIEDLISKVKEILERRKLL